ncbi:MAG TPA: hypothetical protein VM537_35790 [Anaerolineae bacterium]|nr:hypothetical protein [Anaerolineae bacterium]
MGEYNCEYRIVEAGTPEALEKKLNEARNNDFLWLHGPVVTIYRRGHPRYMDSETDRYMLYTVVMVREWDEGDP